MEKGNTSKHIDEFLFVSYVIFLVSVVFSLRAVSSIMIGLILIAGIIRAPGKLKRLTLNKNLLLFLLGLSLLYSIQLVSLAYSTNTNEGLSLLQRRSGLVLIPLAVFCSGGFLTKKTFQRIMLYFSVILCLAGSYCLLVSAFKYFSGASADSFFYHDLVKPLSQHAIQFSIMVFLSLLFLVENLSDIDYYLPRLLSYGMLCFLSLFLVLLSSKLIITFYIIYLLCFFFFKSPYQRKAGAFFLVFAVAILTTIATRNPVGYRFRSILTGNSMLFEQKTFDPGIYFNGAQFRLLEWRFTYEILCERKAWISGLTPGDAQSFLDKKYVETNMYIGIPGSKKHGFIGYHTHNQFLQSLLENGWIGLTLFVFICYSLIRTANHTKRNEIRWFIALLITYCLTDAPFETQYGIVIFSFFPALLYAAHQNSMQSGKTFLFEGSQSAKLSALKQPN